MGMVMIGLWGVISSRRSYLMISALRLLRKSAISAESTLKASDDPDEEQTFRDLWEDETQREMVIEKVSRRTARSGWGGLRIFER
jgi:hypothetical protein